jgi:hypothetical protein
MLEERNGRNLLMRAQDIRTFAASSATEAEESIAKKGVLPDGTKPVQVPKRVWRPQVKNIYEEEELTELPPASSSFIIRSTYLTRKADYEDYCKLSLKFTSETARYENPPFLLMPRVSE